MAEPPPSPQTCGDLGWNPVESAASHSQLAGVVASLLFAGMIVLLTDRGRTVRHTNALVLLTASFFILALDSFLFSIIAGEQICGRAWTSTMIAGGMLGVGALGIFGGLSWLMNPYGAEERHGSRLVTAIAFVVGAVVIIHLWVTTIDYLKDMGPVADVPGWLSPAADAHAAFGFAGILALAALRWRRRRPPRHRVLWAGYLTVGYASVCAVTSGVLLGPGVPAWTDVPAWAVIVAVLLPLSIVTVTIGTHLFALAHSLDPGARKPPGPGRPRLGASRPRP